MPNRIFRLLALVLLLAAAFLAPFPAGAEEGTAYSRFPGPLPIFERPERGSEVEDILWPEEGAPVLELRASGNDLWVRASPGGRTGWFFATELSAYGPVNETSMERVSELYEHYSAARDALFEGMGPDESWVRRPDVRYEGDKFNDPGTIMTLASKEAIIQTMSTREMVLDLYFAANTPEAARRFLGFQALGMTEEELVRHMGGSPEMWGGKRVYTCESGHTSFTFTLKGGRVSKVEYFFDPGNGVELPERVYVLRRFRGEPSTYWPRKGRTNGTHVQVRAEPSVKAEILGQFDEKDQIVTWWETRDRGQEYPWVLVEFPDRARDFKKGWLYGQFFNCSVKENPGYYDSFMDSLQYDLQENVDMLVKKMGAPKKSGEWSDEWPGLVLRYQEFHGKESRERHLTSRRITDPGIEIGGLGGIRIGDPADSLTELTEALFANGWSLPEGQEELREEG
ncbi:MAG: hypothetical protein GX256_10245, partial [Fretibacterium sp.]|nr:hypothetical protein [Fretibacterium sp.]